MKNLLKGGISLVLATSALLPAAAAAESSDLLFGQQHSYTVTMRGNGEAVVLARIVFINTGDKPQDTFTMQIPGSSAPSEIVGFQQGYLQTCSRYGGPQPLLKTPAASGSALPAILPCLEYAVPDYAEPASAQTYDKLKFTQSPGNTYKVTLPKPVPAQQSSSLLLSYSSMGYTHHSLGAYTFEFQTIKVNQRVTGTNVAVSVDSDQYLEGKSSVSYQPSKIDNGAVSAQANRAAPSAAALNQIAQGIGSGGEIDKSASDLAPGDTLVVKGRYASSTFLLRLPGLLTTLGFLLLAILLALVFWKRIVRHIRIHHAKRPKQAPTVAAIAANPAIHAAAPPSPIVSAGNLLAGLVSALGVCGITWFITWNAQANASSYNNPDEFTNILIAITAILAYILFGLGPAVYLAATSRDWRRLVYAVMFEVLFLVAFVLIYAVGIRQLVTHPDGNTVTPYSSESIVQ